MIILLMYVIITLMKTPGINLLSYNVYQALTDVKRSDQILRFVEDSKFDAGALLSGYWTRASAEKPLRDEENPNLARFISHLGSMGYNVFSHDEGDTTSRPDKTGFVGFIKEDVGTGGLLQTDGGRQGYSMDLTEPETGKSIKAAAIHASDINAKLRMADIDGLPDDIDLLEGDLNVMDRRSAVARGLRLLAPGALLIPEARGDWDHNQQTGLGKILQTAVLGKRLVGMARGETMDRLDDKGFVDADPSHRPTVQKAGIGVAQLDHMMYKPYRVSVSDFRIHTDVQVSDHWPISATIRAI